MYAITPANRRIPPVSRGTKIVQSSYSNAIKLESTHPARQEVAI